MFPGDAEERLSTEAADPGGRIAPGNHGIHQLQQGRNLPAGAEKRIPEAFGDIGKSTESLRSHSAQGTQKQRLIHRRIRYGTGEKTGTQKISGFFRHGREGGSVITAGKRGRNGGCGRERGPEHRHGFDGQIQTPDSAEIADGEGVVGGGKEYAGTGQDFSGRGGKSGRITGTFGEAGFEEACEGGRGILKEIRRFLQQGKIRSFDAEGQMGDAERGEQGDSPESIMLRVPHGPEHRQGGHGVRTSGKCAGGPVRRRKEGKRTPLTETGGQRDTDCVRLYQAASTGQVTGMAEVERIVFRNDAENFHSGGSFQG